MKNIVIIGCGDFGREVNWIIGRVNAVKEEWKVVGFVDDNEDLINKKIDGTEVIGNIDFLSKLGNVYVICAVCNSKARKRIIERISHFNNISFATIIDPTAICHHTAEIGEGSVLCCNTMVNIETKIGNHVVLVDRSAVGHNSDVGDYSVMFVGSIVAGNVKIGKCSELGMGSTVIQGKNIGENTVIGASACVIDDIPSNCIAVGVPAKVKK